MPFLRYNAAKASSGAAGAVFLRTAKLATPIAGALLHINVSTPTIEFPIYCRFTIMYLTLIENLHSTTMSYKSK